MPDEQKRKIIVDDDWKAEAQREKERLSRAEAQAQQEPLPEPTFAELVNMIALQALVGLGAMAGAAGERIPPNLEIARHFIDIMKMLEGKTRGNLSAEEKRLLEAALYELRMRYVEVAGAASPPGPAAPSA